MDSEERNKFDLQFQRQVLSASLRDKENYAIYFSLLKEEHFSERKLQLILKFANQFVQRYNAPPLFTHLKQIVVDEDLNEEILQTLNELEQVEYNQEFVRDRLVKFTTHQTLIKRLEKMINFLHAGEYDRLKEEAKEIVFTDSKTDLGMFLIKDLDTRTDARLSGVFDAEHIPCLIKAIDEPLGGGLVKGELLTIMGATSSGKSMLMCNIGKGFLLMGKRVLHITLEMSSKRVANRYDAMLAGIPTAELKEHALDVKTKVGNIARRFGNGEIQIKHFPAFQTTVADIEAHIKLTETALNYYPDLVIVDYGKIMKPESYGNKRRDEAIGEVYGRLRTVGEQFDVCMVTGAQMKATAVNKEVPIVEDIADAQEINRISDVVLTIAATQDEKKQNRARLVINKNREGEANTGKGSIIIMEKNLQLIRDCEEQDRKSKWFDKKSREVFGDNEDEE